MPSKRQPSKQRRAAQNRNTRAQRAARAEHAGELAATAPATNGKAAKGRAASEADAPTPRSGSLLSNLFGGGKSGRGGADGDAGADKTADQPEPSPRGGRPQPQAMAEPGRGLVATKPDGTRVPGAMATFLAVVLAALACALLLVAPLIEVDDRGETVPVATEGFKGLYLEARGIDVNGEVGNPVETETQTLIEAEGPQMAVVFALPFLIVGISYWSHRKTGLSRPLTFGMLAVAVSVLFMSAFGQYYIPALIALAVGSFQARKAELPARTAARLTREDTEDDEDDVIDVDSVEEVHDLEDDAELEDDELEDEDEDDDLDDEDDAKR